MIKKYEKIELINNSYTPPSCSHRNNDSRTIIWNLHWLPFIVTHDPLEHFYNTYRRVGRLHAFIDFKVHQDLPVHQLCCQVNNSSILVFEIYLEHVAFHKPKSARLTWTLSFAKDKLNVGVMKLLWIWISQWHIFLVQLDYSLDNLK